MYVGFIVGIIIAVALIVLGIVAMILAKKKHTKSKWGIWVILIGIVALISAAINFNLFSI